MVIGGGAQIRTGGVRRDLSKPIDTILRERFWVDTAIAGSWVRAELAASQFEAVVQFARFMVLVLGGIADR